MARSEAIKRRQNVTICVSNNQTGCTGGDYSSGFTNDFADGWIIFIDCNADGSYDASGVDCDGDGPDDQDIIIRTKDSSKGLSIKKADNTSWVSYRLTGRSSSNNAIFQIKETGSSSIARKIIINRSGHVRSQ
jgi:Tfp pilus assembly protein FimT